MSDDPPATAQRPRALSPLARMNLIGFPLGGLFTILVAFVDQLYRPDGRPMIVAAGIGLLVLPVMLAKWASESPSTTIVLSCFAMAATAACAEYAVNPALSIAAACAMGMVTLGGAMRLPARRVWWLLPPGMLTAVYVVYTTDLTGSVKLAVLGFVLTLTTVPAVTTLYYRRQLEDALAQVTELATTDALTGLANRRGMLERAPLLFAEAHRRGLLVAVLMVDIDHFKQFNDRFGHLAGDEALRSVADTVSRSVRRTDITVRYGGEELCVVSAIDRDGDLLALAERIRKNVESSHPGGVTVSIGATTRQPHGALSSTGLLYAMIDEADGLLYEAKHAGRNQALVTPSETRT